mgnify:CR=1 FL=1
MEERKSGNTVLLTVIGIATLLVAIVGATFAFFTANITNPVGSSIKIETATLEITFEDGDVIDLLSAHPGNIDGLGNEAVSKTFTVTNNTSYAAHYNLVWNKLEHNVVFPTHDVPSIIIILPLSMFPSLFYIFLSY